MAPRQSTRGKTAGKAARSAVLSNSQSSTSFQASDVLSQTGSPMLSTELASSHSSFDDLSMLPSSSSALQHDNNSPPYPPCQIISNKNLELMIPSLVERCFKGNDLIHCYCGTRPIVPTLRSEGTLVWLCEKGWGKPDACDFIFEAHHIEWIKNFRKASQEKARTGQFEREEASEFDFPQMARSIHRNDIPRSQRFDSRAGSHDAGRRVRGPNRARKGRQNNFWAVAKGRETGIWDQWYKAKALIDRYPDSNYKGFVTHKEAEEWLADHESFQGKLEEKGFFQADPPNKLANNSSSLYEQDPAYEQAVQAARTQSTDMLYNKIIGVLGEDNNYVSHSVEAPLRKLVNSFVAEFSKVQAGFHVADSERKAGQEKIQALEDSVRRLNLKLAHLSGSQWVE